MRFASRVDEKSRPRHHFFLITNTTLSFTRWPSKWTFLARSDTPMWLRRRQWPYRKSSPRRRLEAGNSPRLTSPCRWYPSLVRLLGFVGRSQGCRYPISRQAKNCTSNESFQCRRLCEDHVGLKSFLTHRSGAYDQPELPPFVPLYDGNSTTLASTTRLCDQDQPDQPATPGSSAPSGVKGPKKRVPRVEFAHIHMPNPTLAPAAPPAGQYDCWINSCLQLRLSK